MDVVRKVKNITSIHYNIHPISTLVVVWWKPWWINFLIHIRMAAQASLIRNHFTMEWKLQLYTLTRLLHNYRKCCIQLKTGVGRYGEVYCRLVIWIQEYPELVSVNPLLALGSARRRVPLNRALPSDIGGLQQVFP